MNATLERIKAAKDLGEVLFHMKEWDVDLLLVEPSRRTVMSIKEQCGLEVDASGNVTAGDMEAFSDACLVEMVRDKDGGKVFESEEQAKEILEEKSVKSYRKLATACQELIREPDEKSIKEAEGNSDGTRSQPSSIG